MLLNYIKIAIRNLMRQKMFSFINITGLACGLAICILILLWIQDEYNYDRFNENAERIYRVDFTYLYNGTEKQHWRTPTPMASAIKEKYPEIENAVCFHNEGLVLVAANDKAIKFQPGYSTQEMFEIFTFDFLYGDESSALTKPDAIVLSRETSETLFGEINPVGQVIDVNRQFDMTVTGVIDDLPANSHLQFDFLVPMSIMSDITGYPADDWGDFGYNTFVLLKDGAEIAQVEKDINAFMDELIYELGRKFYLQPLVDIHLYQLDGTLGAMLYVYVFSSIALFILLMACINFMNLSTVRSVKRAREIGVRKLAGARRNQLRAQFIGESLLMSFLSLLFAIGIAELLTPFFNDITGKELGLSSLSGSLVLLIVGITAFTGLVAGIYPAFLLSSFDPLETLKGNGRKSMTTFRKALVIFQFALATALIFCTTVIVRQLRYAQNYDLGFSKENVLYLPLNISYVEKLESLKEELLHIPEVSSVTTTSSKLGLGPKWSIGVRGWEGNEEGEMSLPIITGDKDFLQTFGLQVVQGDFHRKSAYEEDEPFGYVLNESALRLTGLEDPIGKKYADGVIVGVVRDFNYWSIHNPLQPLGILAIPEWDNYIAMKFNTADLDGFISKVEVVSQKFAPDFPFEYSFLDADYEMSYHRESQLSKLLYGFSALAILISCLGLFGMASFMTQQRTKEIGIRKVLGATVGGITLLLTKTFSKWVVISIVLALPAAWLLMQKWLENFAYKTPVGIGTFLLSGFLSLFIAVATVSFHSVTTAMSSPIKALKYE